MGFIGSGSLNQASTLQPGELRTLTLHAFTQDIQQTSYAVTFSLVTDNATDSVPLTLTIQQPQPNIVFQPLSVDPNTRITLARLTNNGATVTDLDFDVIQNTSGIPANVTVLPDLHHVYLPAGQSIDFQIIPLDLAGQTGYTLLPDSTRLVSSVANPDGSSKLTTAQQTLPGPFDGKVCAGKDWCYVIPAVCDNHCGSGLLPFSFNVTQPITNTVTSSAWYCTNKPNIDVAMRPSISIPPNASILNVSVSADFTPSGGDVYSHAVELLFNNEFMGGATVPDQSRLTLTVSPSAWVSGGAQTINLRSVHPFSNLSHYVVANNFTLSVQVSDYTANICAVDEQDARNRLGLEGTPAPTPVPTLSTTPTPTPDPSLRFVSCSNVSKDGLLLLGDDGRYLGFVLPGSRVMLNETQSPQPVKDNFTWRHVKVEGDIVNLNKTPMYGEPAGGWTGWIQAAKPDNTPLLVERNDCPQLTPAPPPTIDPDGQTLCDGLEQAIRNRQENLHQQVPSLPLELDASQHLVYQPLYSQRNPLLPSVLKFADRPTEKVVPCQYLNGQTLVTRFASNDEELQILSYAVHYSTGMRETLNNWCYSGDDFVENGTAERNDPTKYKAGYNVPPLNFNCQTLQGNNDYPCGTLIASVYRSMGYYNTAYFFQQYNLDPSPQTAVYPYPAPAQLSALYWSAALPALDALKDGGQPSIPIFTRQFFRVRVNFEDDAGNKIEDQSIPWPGNKAEYLDPHQLYFKIRPGDLAITRIENPDPEAEDPALRNHYPHIAIIIGWGPKDPQQFNGQNLYARYPGDPNYVPYVMDRGLFDYKLGPASTFQSRGPRPYWCPKCKALGYQATGYELWTTASGD